MPRILAPQNPSRSALAISARTASNLLFVLVADIDVALLGPADKSSEDDSLDQQVRGKERAGRDL